jgi:hypothetical protein
MNTFILSYDPYGSKLSTAQIIGYIEASRDIHQWYPPFAGTVFLKSMDTLPSLSEKFRTQFGGGLCVVTQVSPSMMGGTLPTEVWAWLGASATPTFPIWLGPKPIDS